MTPENKSLLLGALGAIAGGVAGYYGFFWMVRQGFYSPILPGAFLGLGAGFCVRHRSNLLGATCGVAAIALGFFTQWRAVINQGGEETFLDYLRYAYSEPPVTLIMIGLGGFFGYRFALGTGKKPTRLTAPASAVETASQPLPPS
jgi:hypothetical protein